MSFGDFASAMLGLFIFIICPILIIKWIVRKINKAANKAANVRRKNKIQKENESVIEKYAILIENGVNRYKMAKFILEEPLLTSGLIDEDNPAIVHKERELFVSLPIKDLCKFEKDYNYYCIQRKDEFAKYCEFEGINVTEFFSVENMDGYEEISSNWKHYPNAYISCFGMVERNEKSTMDWEIGIVADEIMKRSRQLSSNTITTPI